VYYVYILRSERDGKLYTGSTGDVQRRLAEHNRGKVRSTTGRRPFVLIYSEAFSDKAAAQARERYFKTPEGGVLKRRLIEESSTRLVD
jgi:putative endonuclease